MYSCIFCQIIAKQISSKIIYENQDIIAFDDMNPAASIHFLIVPKQHIMTLADCGKQQIVLLGQMSILAPKLAKKQGCGYEINSSGIKIGGFKVFFNIGPDGGQEIYHLHMHVLGKKF